MMYLLGFLGCLLAGYILLLISYRKSWKTIPYYHCEDLTDRLPFLSVVISARNEAHNLPALLTDLQKQSLPQNRFEVIVIDDHSTDKTADVVASFGGNIRLLQLSDFLSEPVVAYKKMAIRLGIDHAAGELIVCTDADCRVQPHWLQTIAAFAEKENPAFLVMPVFMQHNHKMFPVFQSLDFMTMQGITAAAVHKRWHNMSNGANIAFPKKVFYAVNGFEGIDHIASGDDMLLMQKINAAFPGKTRYLLSPSVIVSTAPCSTLRRFIQQRVRWASKFGHYRSFRISAVLIWVYLLNLLLVIIPVCTLLFRSSLTVSSGCVAQLWLGMVALKSITELFFLYPVAGFFNSRKLLWWFVPLQPFHWLYIIVAGAFGVFKQYRWKDRRVR